MLLLKYLFLSLCPGDEGPPPVALPPLPPGPPLAHPLAPPHAAPDGDVGGGMDGIPAPAPGRDGAPTLAPEAEEGTEAQDLGGDMTGHNPVQTTETESGTRTESGTGAESGTGTESGRGTEIETGTGDATQHADEQGKTEFLQALKMS